MIVTPGIMEQDRSKLRVLTTSIMELTYGAGTPCDGDTFNIITDPENSWTISDNKIWITCSPTSGRGNATITVSVGATTGLGQITITSSAPNVYVDIYNLSSCL